MGRRKGHGWVNGLQSWERGGERGESRAGLVLEGPESKLCMYLPPSSLSVFSVGVQVFPQGSLCLGLDRQDHACQPGSSPDRLLPSLWRRGFWDVIAAATQVGLSLAHSCAAAHVLPIPPAMATATRAARVP